MPTVSNDGISIRDLVYSLNPKEFNEIPEEILSFLERLLNLDPLGRISARDSLKNEWLKSL